MTKIQVYFNCLHCFVDKNPMIYYGIKNMTMFIQCWGQKTQKDKNSRCQKSRFRLYFEAYWRLGLEESTIEERRRIEVSLPQMQSVATSMFQLNSRSEFADDVESPLSNPVTTFWRGDRPIMPDTIRTSQAEHTP